MPVLLQEEKPLKTRGPPKCQIITVIIFILAACSIGVYFFYTKYIKKEICSTEECLRGSLSILSSIDISVNPCDDFHQFTCGNYLQRDFELGTESQYAYPEFLLENHINSIIIDSTSGSEWKLLEAERHFYQACRDVSTIDEDENESLMHFLNEAGGWPMLQGPWNVTNFDLTNFLNFCYELGIPFEQFFRISFSTDMNVIQLVPPMGLEQPEDDSRTLIYHKLIVETVELLGGLEYTAEIEAAKLIEFEKYLGKVWANYNSSKCQILDSELVRLIFPKVNIPLLLERTVGEYLGIDGDNITATDPDVLSALNLLLAGTPPRTLVNYVIWKFIEDQSSFLASPLREKFQVYDSISKNGYKVARRDICLAESKKRFPRVAEIGWMQNMLEKNTSQVLTLINNIKDALISRIHSLDFIAKGTKKQVTDKIKNIKRVVWALYDEDLPNVLHSGKTFNNTDNVFHMAREQNIHNFNLKSQMINESGKNFEEYLDKSLTSEIVFTEEAIVLPALFLQRYFYSSTRPNYFNFAGLGSEIAKKFVKELLEYLDKSKDIFKDIMSNSFIWTHQDLFNLFLRSKCAAEDYLAAGFSDDITTEVFLENCADLIGIDISYEAYQKSLEKRKADLHLPLLAYNPNQLFWIYFGRQYCSEYGQEHNGLPLEYRQLNAVKNSRYFARDFNCAVGSTMNPQRKCIII